MEAWSTRSEATSVVRLQGKCTIERADELKGLLSRTLQCSDQVLLELDGLTEADLSCLLLIYSVHKSASKEGKRLALHGIIPEFFAQLVRDAGFAHAIDELRTCKDDHAE